MTVQSVNDLITFRILHSTLYPFGVGKWVPATAGNV